MSSNERGVYFGVPADSVLRGDVVLVRPADKGIMIRALQQPGQVVAMVGDGVNDAPALATPGISIAIGSGSEVAKEAGDLLLLGKDPGAMVTAIGLSRATMRKICQTLFWAGVYISLGCRSMRWAG